eukprot:6618853-Prymnesium_polylepis.1
MIPRGRDEATRSAGARRHTPCPNGPLRVCVLPCHAHASCLRRFTPRRGALQICVRRTHAKPTTARAAEQHPLVRVSSCKGRSASDDIRV